MLHTRLGCRDLCLSTLKFYRFLSFPFLLFFPTSLFFTEFSQVDKNGLMAVEFMLVQGFHVALHFVTRTSSWVLLCTLSHHLLGLQVKTHVQKYISNVTYQKTGCGACGY